MGAPSDQFLCILYELASFLGSVSLQSILGPPQNNSSLILAVWGRGAKQGGGVGGSQPSLNFGWGGGTHVNHP